jgi:hypothetical protein
VSHGRVRADGEDLLELIYHHHEMAARCALALKGPMREVV